MTEGRILALDYGSKRVGAAISDITRTIAAQNFLMQPKDLEGDCAVLREFIEVHEVTLVVLGYPALLNGTEGSQAAQVRQVKNHLSAALPIPVLLWDERMTTAAAERTLIEGGVSRKKRKGLVDKVAATLILQSYLETL